MENILERITDLHLVFNFFLGLITFFVMKIIYDWLSYREQKNIINNANNNIISLLKVYVASNQLPEEKAIDSIIKKVAKEYHLNYKTLYSINKFYEEVMNDIMDDAFISQENKDAYINVLQLRKETTNNDTTTIKPSFINDRQTSYSPKLCFIAIIATLIVSFSCFMKEYEAYDLLITSFTIFILLVIVIYTFIEKKVHKRLAYRFRKNRQAKNTLRHERSLELTQLRIDNENSKQQKQFIQDREVLDNEILSIQNERKILEAEKKLHLTETNQLEALKKEIQARTNAVEINQNNINKKQASLEEENQRLVLLQEELTQDRENLENEKLVFTSQIDDLNQQIQQLTELKQNLQEETQLANQEKRSLHEEIDSLTSTINAYKDEFTELASKKDVLEEEVNDLQQKSQSYIKEAKSALINKEQTIEDINELLQKKETLLQDLKTLTTQQLKENTIAPQDAKMENAIDEFITKKDVESIASTEVKAETKPIDNNKDKEVKIIKEDKDIKENNDIKKDKENTKTKITSTEEIEDEDSRSLIDEILSKYTEED